MKPDYNIHSKAPQFYIMAAVGLMGLTILQDKLEANVQDSSFYFSESALFSSFWLLFLPILVIQKLKFKRKFLLFWILLPSAIHMLMYPFLIFMLSGIFFDHTFEIYQTFRFAITNYLWAVVVGYCILPMTFLFRSSNQKQKIEENATQTVFIREANKLHAVNHSEIQYITANSPYVDIITGQRRFLHSSTLRDMEKILGTSFIRVHKSSIVNIAFIHSLVSRQNGDYDLIMKDGCTVRASRNYVAALKKKLSSG